MVDEVAIALPLKSLYDQASRIVAVCEQQGVIVRFLSDLFNLKLARSEAGQLDKDSFFTVYPGAMFGLMPLIKRVLDFSV